MHRKLIMLVTGTVLAAGALAVVPDAASAAQPGQLTVDKTSAPNSGAVTVKICASNLLNGAQVTLEQPVEGSPIEAVEKDYVGNDFFGCGLRLGESSLVVTFDLTGHAPGTWMLSVRNPGESAASQTGFAITGGQPSFAATPVAPSTVNLGTTTDVTIRGEGLYRGLVVATADGDTDPGNDVIVESRTWHDTQTVVARVRVPRNAPLGLIDIVVRNTDGQTRTCPDCLLVDDVNRRFVDAMYAQLLGRASDPGGRAYWLERLTAGTTRPEAAGALIASDEFNGRVVQELFRSILGRPADAAGLAHWVGVLREGHLYANIQAALLGSQEFFTKAGGSRSRFLDAAYVYALGRLPDAQGRAYWNAQMDRGLTRDLVALVLATSAESRARLVDAYFRTFLRRPADGAGLTYWALSMAINGVKEGTVIAALVGSEEFKQLNG